MLIDRLKEALFRLVLLLLISSWLVAGACALEAVAYASDASAKVTITTDKPSYFWGDTLSLILSAENTGEDVRVDFYLAIIDPGGSIYFFGDWSTQMHPGITDLYLPSGFSLQDYLFFSCPIPGAAPPILQDGSFTFAAALISAETGLLLQDISLAPFEVLASSSQCPAGMVKVPAGTFVMGDTSGVGYRDELPVHEVFLDAFCIDIYEYPGQAGSVPEAGLSWVEAQARCTQAGKHLCTEAQWEKACKGPMGYIYPYGDTYDNTKCWTEMGYNDGQPSASGARRRCKSGYGVFDMSGNVAEWVSDWYDPEYYSVSPYRNPAGPELGSFKVLRGGAWFATGLGSRCSFRQAQDPAGSRFFAGLRCCK